MKRESFDYNRTSALCLKSSDNQKKETGRVRLEIERERDNKILNVHHKHYMHYNHIIIYMTMHTYLYVIICNGL